MGLKRFLFVSLRVLKYKLLSDCKRVSGKVVAHQPVLCKGAGAIAFGQNVQVGVIASPAYYSHYGYFEARYPESRISIGNNVSINNAFTAIAFSGISIGNDVLIGTHCTIIDNDGHELDPGKRRSGTPLIAPVSIGNNVFIGSGVTILKGVSIGDHAVIGNGAVVTRDVPEAAVVAGNPARIIKTL